MLPYQRYPAQNTAVPCNVIPLDGLHLLKLATILPLRTPQAMIVESWLFQLTATLQHWCCDHVALAHVVHAMATTNVRGIRPCHRPPRPAKEVVFAREMTSLEDDVGDGPGVLADIAHDSSCWRGIRFGKNSRECSIHQLGPLMPWARRYAVMGRIRRGTVDHLAKGWTALSRSRACFLHQWM